MFKHLLVPLDGSPLAEAALPAALKLADKFDSEVTLLRVVQSPHLILSNTGGSAYAELIVGVRNQAQADACIYLKGHQGSLRQQGYKIHVHMVTGEPVAEMILEVASGIGADTIVMSTHGRGGVSRLMYGSVADQVLRQARVPIVLIRAAEGLRPYQLEEEPVESLN